MDEIRKVQQYLELLKSELKNWQWKNHTTHYPSIDNIIIAIIANDPLVGIVGRIIKISNDDSGCDVYKLEILISSGPVYIHQVNDSGNIYVNSFEICKVIE